jgi:hypothetical protein
MHCVVAVRSFHHLCFAQPLLQHLLCFGHLLALTTAVLLVACSP